jgi:hypothetical protein
MVIPFWYHILYAERQRPAAPEGGATGALAAGVPLPGVCSGAWFGDFSASIRIN